jgi:hypothetical protein
VAQGIGAVDAEVMPTQTPNGVQYIAPAGWLFTQARLWANWERMRAFDRIPSYAVLEPAGNHPPNGATEAELRLGCPAWPVPEDAADRFNRGERL